MELLTIFGLTVGETVALLTFAALLIGGIIQMNVRMKGNEDQIKLVATDTDNKITALKEATCAEIRALTEATNLRIRSLEQGRLQNAANIETMRKENREDHKAILDKLDAMTNSRQRRGKNDAA